MRNTPIYTATNALIATCIAIYFVLNQIHGRGFSGYELFFIDNPNFAPIQFLSHMFLHGSPTHLFFNMFGLWMFGNSVERIWGIKKFLFFYFMCGFGAAFIYLAMNYYQFQVAIAPIIDAGIRLDDLEILFIEGKSASQFPTSQEALITFWSHVVGASGALYGVLVAFAFLFPNHKIMLIFLPVPVAAKFFVPALLAIDVLSEFTGFSIFGQNIAHAAHVGGAITGILLMLSVMKKKPQQTDSFGIWKK